MHELSLIYGLIEMIVNDAAARGISRIALVRLVVGKCYGALPEALQFAFEVLSRNTPCQGAHLEIAECSGQELRVDFYQGE